MKVYEGRATNKFNLHGDGPDLKAAQVEATRPFEETSSVRIGQMRLPGGGDKRLQHFVNDVKDLSSTKNTQSVTPITLSERPSPVIHRYLFVLPGGNGLDVTSNDSGIVDENISTLILSIPTDDP